MKILCFSRASNIAYIIDEYLSIIVLTIERMFKFLTYFFMTNFIFFLQMWVKNSPLPTTNFKSNILLWLEVLYLINY